MKPQTWPLFVVAPPGLEAPLAAELGALTEGAVKIEEGGVRLQGDMLDAAAICLWSRCAARTLLIVGDEDVMLDGVGALELGLFDGGLHREGLAGVQEGAPGQGLH